MLALWLVLGATALVGLGLIAWRLRARGLGIWLVPYAVQTLRRRLPRREQEVHLLLCITDHFEPKNSGASPEQARQRVRRWVEDYPRQFGDFRDSDSRTPRHTFFYPMEAYDPEHLDALGTLCRAGFGEVEIHLHHNDDTAQSLHAQLLKFKALLTERHGLLSRRKGTGEVAYGFIHGNWALCNSRPDGTWCGVNEELDVLRETGCYADFTYPSAPHPTQPAKINSLYYARTLPGRRRSHHRGSDVGCGPEPADSLLLVQGPLALDWSHRKFGVVPRLENGCLQNSQPPAPSRIDTWLRARVQVSSRPDWFFVKLYAHGAEEESMDALLGEPMRRFHEALVRRARGNPHFHYHYVTAREMYNLVKAAEAGWRGSVAEALNYQLVSNLVESAAYVPPAPHSRTLACEKG